MSPNDHRRTFSSDMKRFFTALGVLPISVVAPLLLQAQNLVVLLRRPGSTPHRRASPPPLHVDPDVVRVPLAALGGAAARDPERDLLPVVAELLDQLQQQPVLLRRPRALRLTPPRRPHLLNARPQHLLVPLHALRVVAPGHVCRSLAPRAPTLRDLHPVVAELLHRLQQQSVLLLRPPPARLRRLHVGSTPHARAAVPRARGDQLAVHHRRQLHRVLAAAPPALRLTPRRGAYRTLLAVGAGCAGVEAAGERVARRGAPVLRGVERGGLQLRGLQGLLLL